MTHSVRTFSDELVDMGSGAKKKVAALVGSTDFDESKLGVTATYVTGTKILTINLLYDGVQQSTVDVDLT